VAVACLLAVYRYTSAEAEEALFGAEMQIFCKYIVAALLLDFYSLGFFLKDYWIWVKVAASCSFLFSSR
jgi:hypothetical protein